MSKKEIEEWSSNNSKLEECIQQFKKLRIENENEEKKMNSENNFHEKIIKQKSTDKNKQTDFPNLKNISQNNEIQTDNSFENNIICDDKQLINKQIQSNQGEQQ